MWLLAFSSALVGFIHSLSPGHWLPIVLIAKSKRWSVSQSLLAAFVAASGHIIFSLSLSICSIAFGVRFIEGFEETVERVSGFALILFGLAYGIYYYYRHARCHGHTHHGPSRTRSQAGVWGFIFLLGFSPCVAALPVFIAASAQGWSAIVASMGAFSFGVILALGSATALASRGWLKKLDSPLLEHYGEVMTGLAIALLGVFLLAFPHSH